MPKSQLGGILYIFPPGVVICYVVVLIMISLLTNSYVLHCMQDSFARARTRPSARDDKVSCIQCVAVSGS